MNREQIIQMAREAKFATEEWGDGLHHVCVFNFQDSETEITKELEAFAKLVAEHEREACAKVCENIYTGEEGCGDWPTPEMCAEAIRARGDDK